MATYNAVAAVTHTVLALLRDGCPRDVFPEAQFEPLVVNGQPPPFPDGATLLLYRVGLNGRRTIQYPARPDGRRPRPAIALDLFYLLSIWGRSAEQQQRLLGWCMRELATHAALPSGVLNQHHLGFTDTFNATEDLELACDPLSLQDLSSIWDVLKPQIPLSIGYVVHLVPIEAPDLVAVGVPVQTRSFDMGGPPW
jgi:Pvc16 N-terminal domain